MYDLLKALDAGEVVIYPTETLYALGCDGTNAEACKRVAQIKGRSAVKPLPLIIGSYEMLSLVTDEKPSALDALAESFWPGPLSVLVKALPDLPRALCDEEGYTSVRWSGHAYAMELSKRLKKPVVATSANLSGEEAVATPEGIDEKLLDLVGATYFDPPWPRGGDASTVVRVLDFTRLEVLREGAVSIKQLCDKGFSVTVRSML